MPPVAPVVCRLAKVCSTLYAITDLWSETGGAQTELVLCEDLRPPERPGLGVELPVQHLVRGEAGQQGQHRQLHLCEGGAGGVAQPGGQQWLLVLKLLQSCLRKRGGLACAMYYALEQNSSY